MNIKKNFKFIFLFPLLITFVFLFLCKTEIFQKFELSTYDWRMKHSRELKTTGKIVLVYIGDTTLKTIGNWPFGRNWYAEFNKVMSEYGAKAVVYDILFLDPSNNPEDDFLFCQTINDSGNVILPSYFSSLSAGGKCLQAEKYHPPYSLFQSFAREEGFINCPPDLDGVIRKYPLFIEYENTMHPSLGIAVAEHYLMDKYLTRKLEKRNVILYGEKQQLKIPVDKSCSALLYFYPDIKDFPNYSFIQVLQSYFHEKKGNTGSVNPMEFKDKIVIVGHTASGTTDIRAIPGTSNYYMMGVHATFLENLLQSTFIRKLEKPINYGIPFILTVILACLMCVFSIWASFILAMSLTGLVIYGSFLLFNSNYLWIEIIPAVSIILFTYLSLTVFQFIKERVEKLKVKSTFSRYLSPPVMEKLMDNPDMVKLGGEEKLLTVLFADIRDFTSISEKLSPEKTVQFLNKLLNIMVENVFKFKGTLDKFIGDAIMVIYGAPVEDEKHALKAVSSAIEMIENLKKFPGIGNIGIGINTGPMVIGNIGSEKRLEYTVIGDAVNLASRLENMAKPGEILLGEETYLKVKEEIKCEFAGSVSIKGKELPQKIYRVAAENFKQLQKK
jgi:adenylate cyclase